MPVPKDSFNRRHALLAGLTATAAYGFSFRDLWAAEENRELDFAVKNEFGTAPVDNVKALLKSVAHEIWQHCPHTKFLGQGFSIYRNKSHPITHFKHEDDRIVIGLNTHNTFWAQYSYQFAHEFCHALIDHTHEAQRKWHLTQHANHWLDECLAETASLFTLRAMSRTWATKPPYGNWKSFAPHLASYIDDRAKDPKHKLPPDTTFSDWLLNLHPSLRVRPTLREVNTIIAFQLLPLFEAEPAGWESITAIKLADRDVMKPLATHLAEWQSNARPEHRDFVQKVSKLLLPMSEAKTSEGTTSEATTEK